MERVPEKKISQFNVRSMSSKRFIWVSPTPTNLISATSILLQETFRSRRYSVAKMDTLLEHYGLQVTGRKSAKVDSLTQHLTPLIEGLVTKGWSPKEVVRQIVSNDVIRPEEDDSGCCRQWLRAVHFNTQEPRDPSSDAKALVTWLTSLPEDTAGVGSSGADEILTTLIRHRFVAPKLRVRSGLMLQSVTFRRHSGIGSGQTLSASTLESLWCKQPLMDRPTSSGVRVLESSRKCGSYNAAIVKHKSEQVRTRTSKVEQRIAKAQRTRNKEMERERIHDHLKAGIMTKKLLSDGFWCRLSGCTRFFQYEKWRALHERRGDQCSGGLTCFRFSRTDTNRQTDRCILINQAIVEARTAGRLRSRTQKMREVDRGLQVSVSLGTGEYRSFVTGGTYVVPAPIRGCMRKRRVTNPPLDDMQMTFLLWAWNVGEINRKKKLSSRQAARLMKVHGTVEGQLM